LKNSLVAGAGILLVIGVVLWFVVMQPDQQSDPRQEAKALYDQGAEYIQLKDFESAVEILEQAHVLNPEDAGTLYALGVAYYKLGNLKLAKAYFTSVLEINPNDEQAKGLMDIMARLERQSGAESEGEESTDN
jgi:tetratricopeptide (TPR) repeat protein